METTTNSPPPPLLPIAIVPGMQIVRLEDNPVGRIEGVTSAYCVFSLGETVWVDRWRNLALSGVSPAPPLLPNSVTENDRLDANARVLRELALLKSLGELTLAQQTTLNELILMLCPK